MGIDRAFSNSEPAGRRARAEDLRRDTHVGVMGIGTLACPRCDAPIAPGPGRMVPTDLVSCPICSHGSPARDFLTLAAPSRPARVVVRLVRRGVPRLTWRR